MADSSQRSTVLESLRFYDELRSKATDVKRVEGSNIDRFSLPDGGEIALCHLSAILPFTSGDYFPLEEGFETMASITLAANHLNVGDGSVVPEVSGLNQRCGVRFTTEFADTEYQGGVSLGHIVEQTNREPGTPERIPCAFLGASRSAVSIPTSIVTGLLGYPQVSASSTSADLDDVSQYPLFARTVPSDRGNAVPIIMYLRNVLEIKNLAVVNVNDSYGNNFVEGMRVAAEEHAPDLIIQQIPLDEGQGSIEAAVESLKSSRCRFVFGLVFTRETHDALLTEAYNQGVAGTGLHTWLFADSFGSTLDGRTFENGSPLHLSYRGTGLLEISGGVEGLPDFDSFSAKMAELKNPTDLAYLESISPRQNHPNFGSDVPFLYSEDFITPPKDGFIPFWYEATIALGLAACKAFDENISFTGQEHFDRLVETTFKGISGSVAFTQETGTRDPSSALYKVANYVEGEEIDPDTGNVVIRFNPVVTDLFLDGDWVTQADYVFNDGTTTLPAYLPPPEADEAQLGLILGVSAGVAFLLGVLVFLFYENKRKQNDSVWKIEKEDIKFDEPAQIIGRGTFGLVLLGEYRGTQVAVKRVIPQRSKDENGDSGETDITVGMKSARMGLSSGYNVGTSSWGGISLGLQSRKAGASTLIDQRRVERSNWRKMKNEFIEEMRYLSKLRHPCITTIMGKSFVSSLNGF